MPEVRKIPFNSDCYSEIAMPGDRIICVSPEELVESGVAKSIEYLIKVSIPRQRKGLVYCYPYHKEDRDIYFHFDGLKANYKELIKNTLCGGVDVTVWLENEETRRKEKEARRFANNLASSLAVSEEVEEYFKGLDLYTVTECAQLARAAAWLKMLSTVSAKFAHSKGFKSVKDLRSAALKEVAVETTNNLVAGISAISERVMTRKVFDFGQSGIECLIDKRKFANKRNAEKLTTEAKDWLVSEYSNPSPKISVVDLSEKYNTVMVEAYDWKKVTVSDIEKFLSRPAVKALWFRPRHGKVATINHIMPQTVREKVSQPDAIWSIDGTPVQRYYRDENGKLRSNLYLYVVTDAHSSAIIGHAIGLTENSELVTRAMLDALVSRKRKPYQLQYDQGSVHLADAINALFKNMTNVHFPCAAQKARPKWVESILGQFQAQQEKTKADYKGSNVTATSLDQKSNPDTWKGKRTDILTLEELVKDVESSIEAYNNTGKQRDKHGVRYGDTPLDLYNAEYKGKKELTNLEISSLFVVQLTKPVRYTTKGIKKIIDGEKCYFMVADRENGTTDFNFQRNWLNKEFQAKVSLIGFKTFMKLYHKDKYITTAYVRQKLAPSALDLKLGNGANPAEFRIGLKDWEEYNRQEYEKMLQVGRSINVLKPTGTDGATSWQTMTKEAFNAWESEEVDKQNGVYESNETIDKLLAKYK